MNNMIVLYETDIKGVKSMYQQTERDKNFISQQNKRNIYDYISKNGPVNRARIAKEIRLSIPSVMAITEELIQEGMIKTSGRGESTGGKRPELLDAVPEYQYTVGVAVDRKRLRITILDSTRSIVCNCTFPTGAIYPEHDFCVRLSATIEDIISQASIPKNRIIGVGIAVPGLIDRRTGTVMFIPGFKWKNVPIREWMAEILPYPVFIENINMAYALAERECSPQPKENLFCINFSHGIGGAFIWNGIPCYGMSGTSGEIGHITVNRNGPLCACGNLGCLEAMASEDAITRQAQALAQTESAGAFAQYANHLNELNANVVLSLAKQGEPQAVDIIKNAVEYIGIGIATVINLIDSDRVVLFGGLIDDDATFMDQVLEVVGRRRMHSAGQKVIVEKGKLGALGAVFGAACLAYIK